MKLKRAGALLLSLLILITCCTACKPDNIAPPAAILDPAEQPAVSVPEQTPAENNVTPAPDNTAEPDREQPEQTEPVEEPEKTAEPDQTEEQQPAETPEKTENAGNGEQEPVEEATPPFAPQALSENPLEQPEFTPSAGTESRLPVSGWIKNTAAASFENAVFRIITADENPAFQFSDERGRSVSEWDWLKGVCEKYGAKFKYTVKNASLSVKAQRVALYAGLPLSLVQLNGNDLGTGLTLTAKVTDAEIDAAVQSYGVSKTVFEKSNRRLLAPRGSFASFWYDITVLTGDEEPRALLQEKNWTLERYAAVYNGAVRRGLQPVALNDPLVWATVGGISPLTLLNDKLDHNIHARVVREVWTALRSMNEGLEPFTPDPKITYKTEEGTLALEYTDLPGAAKKQTLQWIGLPALAKEGENPVTFTGACVALPRWGLSEEQRLLSLILAELWCNRYTEVRAAALANLGVTGEGYKEYVEYGEAHGYLILHNRTIEELAKPYLDCLNDPAKDMEEIWTSTCKKPIDNYIETQNVFY